MLSNFIEALSFGQKLELKNLVCDLDDQGKAPLDLTGGFINDFVETLGSDFRQSLAVGHTPVQLVHSSWPVWSQVVPEVWKIGAVAHVLDERVLVEAVEVLDVGLQGN